MIIKETISFDARDVLERSSENMEWMTALLDKMYIKLDQKEAPYKPQIYKKEVEDRISKILDKVVIGEEVGHLVENVAMIIIEDIEEVEVILEELAFEVGLVIILGKIIVETEIQRIEGLKDSLDQEKEE